MPRAGGGAMGQARHRAKLYVGAEMVDPCVSAAITYVAGWIVRYVPSVSIYLKDMEGVVFEIGASCNFIMWYIRDLNAEKGRTVMLVCVEDGDPSSRHETEIRVPVLYAGLEECTHLPKDTPEDKCEGMSDEECEDMIS